MKYMGAKIKELFSLLRVKNKKTKEILKILLHYERFCFII
jgi:hypothetical protein